MSSLPFLGPCSACFPGGLVVNVLNLHIIDLDK
jgi:hypothetical protein